ncbi:hypothetical protein [Nannocystis punicea]|uniref:Uncharacterized protein n=1 Tax=Nannocystis punicea TaxID=2995304 RepID=A0ABY7GXV0_9BACT|nr:hypothetical protein [Nannocystis poenicansa]WAS91806.1 hypothetical protein O0S08_36955 [Nannocystis poenicansa]
MATAVREHALMVKDSPRRLRWRVEALHDTAMALPRALAEERGMG